MNAHIFASAVGRWVAPAVLAATTFCGTMGFSSVASAEEVVAAPAVRVAVAAPVLAPRLVTRPVVRPGVVVAAPYYYGYRGPAWGGGFYGGHLGPGWGYGHAGFGGRGAFHGGRR